MIDNKTADKITKVLKNSPQNKSEKVTNEHGREVRKKYICL